jgi:hypothetical protein
MMFGMPAIILWLVGLSLAQHYQGFWQRPDIIPMIIFLCLVLTMLGIIVMVEGVAPAFGCREFAPMDFRCVHASKFMEDALNIAYLMILLLTLGGLGLATMAVVYIWSIVLIVKRLLSRLKRSQP